MIETVPVISNLENASALAITEAVVNACAEGKGKDITVLDVRSVFDAADYFVVVSGRSDRQVQGISNRVLDALEQRGISPYSREGLEEGQWVLLDFGDVIVHVFYEVARERYDIEGLWARAKRMSYDELENGEIHVRAA